MQQNQSIDNEVLEAKRELRREKRRRRWRCLGRFLWRAIIRPLLIILSLVALYGILIKTAPEKTGMDNGFGFFPLRQIQILTYRKVDLMSLLRDAGFEPEEIYRNDLEETELVVGALVIGDIGPLNDGVSDYLMRNCSFNWVTEVCGVKALYYAVVINQLLSRSQVESIAGMILKEYTYQHVNIKPYPNR